MKYEPTLIERLSYTELCELARDIRRGIDNEKDIELSKELYRKAIAVNPDRGDAFSGLGVCYEIQKEYDTALHLYQRAYELGFKDGLANIGDLYNNGWGVEEDKNKALNYYKKAAAEGSGRGCYILSTLYSLGDLGLDEDEEKEYYWAKKSAEYGNAGGYLVLGMCYEYGRGCEKNLDEAKSAYIKGSDLKEGDAAHRLWEYYRNDAYGEVNNDKALQYLKRACDLRYELALFNMSVLYTNGELVEKNQEKAEELLIQAAEEGYKNADYYLAKDYCDGDRFPHDMDKAEYWARKALAHGDCRGMIALYERYCDRTCSDVDLKKGFELKQEAAESGDLEALHDVAISYMGGIGVEKDTELGIRLLRENAERGCDYSINALGIAYINGDGVEKDSNQALIWWKKATDMGSVGACSRIYHEAYNGIFSEREDKKELVIKYINKAVELGNDDAKCDLASMYIFEPEYFEQNYNKAIKLWEQAAENGSVRAYKALAICYRDGEGVDVSTEKAIEYYKLAIETGDTDAMIQLGNLFSFGLQEEANPDEAAKYYRMAHEAGDYEGSSRLAGLLTTGVISVGEALELCELAADHDNARGKYLLAVALSGGIGKVDLPKAKTLFEDLLGVGDFAPNEVAHHLISVYKQLSNEEGFNGLMALAEKGNVEAEFEVGCAYEDGIGTEEDKEKAIIWHRKAADDGHPVSEALLGNIYLPFSSNPLEIEDAIRYLRSSARRGNKESLYSLLSLYSGEYNSRYSGNKDAAIDFLIELGNEENIEAQSLLGHIYDGCGPDGYTDYVDKENAVYWYGRAGDNGDVESLCNLAINYHEGDGVPIDHEKEIELLKKASELGCSKAKYNLAVKLNTGSCGKEDKKLAKRLLLDLVSLEPNDEVNDEKKYMGKSLCYLGYIFEEENDYAKAKEYYLKALGSETLNDDEINIVQNCLEGITERQKKRAGEQKKTHSPKREASSIASNNPSHNPKTTNTTNEETEHKTNRIKYLLIGIGILSVLCIIVFIASNTGSDEEYMDQENTGNSDDYYENYYPEDNSYSDDEQRDDYIHYEREGVQFDLPSSWEETVDNDSELGSGYIYWSDEGASIRLSSTENTTDGMDIEEYWDEYPEWFNGEDQVYVDSGTREIDGVTAYWVEDDIFYDDGTVDRDYQMMIPLDDYGDKCVWITTLYNGDSEVEKAAKEGLECMLDGMSIGN